MQSEEETSIVEFFIEGGILLSLIRLNSLNIVGA